MSSGHLCVGALLVLFVIHPALSSEFRGSDPIADLLSRGRERDLPGAQAIHPVPLPRSRTPAESTIPRLLTVSSMLPPLVRQRRLQRINHIGAIARLQHLLPTLQEWCCHHPCKARFRLAG